MTDTIPGYKIIRAIGKGGMATVYLAEQEIFGRQVALKIMSKALGEDSAFGERFMREAKIVSQLVHPNIVTVHDVGVYEDSYYLSMEYIDGKDLRHLRDNLSLAQKFSAVRDIAKALQYASSKGYVHRDIKPENIMFYTADNRAVLTDFGIARAAETDKSMTQTGVAIGTPHYMSPEQAKGKPVDHRSDLYSLGVVFFQLLSGYVPYDAESAVAIGIKHITEPVPLLPIGFEKMQPIIDTLMAKKPEERYQNAEEFLEDLDLIDIEDLDRLVQWAQKNSSSENNTSSNADLPTIVTPINKAAMSAKVSTAARSRPSRPKMAPVSDEVERFTMVYETLEDDFEHEKSSPWPWVFGGAILASVLGGVFYQQHSLSIDSWLQNSRQMVVQTFSNVMGGETEDTNTVLGESKKVIPDSVAPVTSTAQEPISTVTSAQKKTFEKEEPATAEVIEKQSSIITPLVKEKPLPEESADEAGIVETVELVAQPEEPVDDTVVDVKQPVSEEPEVLEESLAITKLREQATTLEALYQTDGAYLADLVAAYRDVLANVPDDIETLAAMKALLQTEVNDVTVLISQEKFAVSEKKITQLKYLFRNYADQELVSLEKELNRLEKITTLLNEGDQLLQKKQLTRPENNNAVTKFKAVLKLDPDNTTAKTKLAECGSTLLSIARNSYSAGDLAKAKSYLDSADAAAGENEKSKQLRGRINSELNRRQAIQALLVRARQQLNDEQLFTPPGANALDSFQRVLEKESNNAQALQGIEEVVDALSTKVWNMVSAEKFEQALAELDEPQRALPANDRIHSLSLAVKEVIAERERMKPKIVGFQIGDSSTSDLSDINQGQVFTLSQNISLSFDYKNLPIDDQSLVLTILDATSKAEVYRQAILLTDKVGTHSLPLPSTSIPQAGRYQIQVLLKGEVLTSGVVTFQ
ncbi:serine/threonine protein kinase [Teredinibacter sp. KSP-S5-2]|uniref:serine/threonine protein kinase n=1 Tax=Teredinibacter sp. KSP-S5-2 TaxID=3034506 RepID=UPI0029350CAA|nr:protein kinase [Teredinibacter sp. KSP-S5-2]WNO10177.1 protein kinase [Teredinibacter sp. KSP-S5-2]